MNRASFGAILVGASALAGLATAPIPAAKARTAKGAIETARIAPGKVFADCTDVCPRLVAIAPGTFRMGADAGEEGRPEGPVHTVTLKHAFALGVTEVTNAQFARFIAETGYAASTGCRSLDPGTGTMAKVAGADFRHPGPGAGEGAPQMPVVCVSWRDAQAYVAWLSRKTGQRYRLPTEAEWEFAARAGSSGDYPWGDRAEEACRYANTLDVDGVASGLIPVFGGTSGASAQPLAHAACHDGHAGAAPVASFAPNALGLYDMIGNVWEWTQDCYVAPYPASGPLDGSAYTAPDCPLRAVRGGSWISTPFRNRSSWRGRDPVEQVTWIFGMRIARDLAESAS